MSFCLDSSTPVFALPKLVIDQERFAKTGLAQYISDVNVKRPGTLRVVVHNGERCITYIPRNSMQWSDWMYRFLGIKGYGLQEVVSALKNVVIPDQYDDLLRKQLVHLVTDYNSRRIWHFCRKIPLERIFRRNIFYLPPQIDLQSLGSTRVHKIWRKNLQTLIGILATEKIPRLGFHGTDSYGLNGILSTHVSNPKYLWVAGINIALDPITRLADFYRAAHKAYNYGPDADGGIFVLRTRLDQHIGKYVHDISEDEEDLRDLDTVNDKTFFHLVHRNIVGEDERWDRSGQTFGVDAALIRGHIGNPDSLHHPKDIFTVDEYHVAFNPKTYSEVVRGVILNADAVYQYRLPRTNQEYTLQCLASRLRQQEFLLKVFAPYVEWSEKKVREYTQTGKYLLQHTDQIPLFSLQQLTSD